MSGGEVGGTQTCRVRLNGEFVEIVGSAGTAALGKDECEMTCSTRIVGKGNKLIDEVVARNGQSD